MPSEYNQCFMRGMPTTMDRNSKENNPRFLPEYTSCDKKQRNKYTLLDYLIIMCNVFIFLNKYNLYTSSAFTLYSIKNNKVDYFFFL